MNHQRFVRLLLVVILSATEPAFAQEKATRKKLIEWAWDEPDTKFICENIEAMEKYLFDGLVFHASSSQGGNFTWEMWGGRRFELSEFQHLIDDLRATTFRRFTEWFSLVVRRRLSYYTYQRACICWPSR
ncbi:MAG: hypothetical protein KY475_17480 [Planctomycetes bacterium]|nr:hypothetical protein [Planctomycetota bacterium]